MLKYVHSFTITYFHKISESDNEALSDIPLETLFVLLFLKQIKPNLVNCNYLYRVIINYCPIAVGVGDVVEASLIHEGDYYRR
jgi:hypothetical protein